MRTSEVSTSPTTDSPNPARKKKKRKATAPSAQAPPKRGSHRLLWFAVAGSAVLLAGVVALVALANASLPEYPGFLVNGLDVPVVVRLNGERHHLPANSWRGVDVGEPHDVPELAIRTEANGVVLEEFTVEHSGRRPYFVYTVGGAGMFEIEVISQTDGYRRTETATHIYETWGPLRETRRTQRITGRPMRQFAKFGTDKIPKVSVHFRNVSWRGLTAHELRQSPTAVGTIIAAQGRVARLDEFVYKDLPDRAFKWGDVSLPLSFKRWVHRFTPLQGAAEHYPEVAEAVAFYELVEMHRKYHGEPWSEILAAAPVASLWAYRDNFDAALVGLMRIDPRALVRMQPLSVKGMQTLVEADDDFASWISHCALHYSVRSEELAVAFETLDAMEDPWREAAFELMPSDVAFLADHEPHMLRVLSGLDGIARDRFMHLVRGSAPRMENHLDVVLDFMSQHGESMTLAEIRFLSISTRLRLDHNPVLGWSESTRRGVSETFEPDMLERLAQLNDEVASHVLQDGTLAELVRVWHERNLPVLNDATHEQRKALTRLPEHAVARIGGWRPSRVQLVFANLDQPRIQRLLTETELTNYRRLPSVFDSDERIATVLELSSADFDLLLRHNAFSTYLITPVRDRQAMLERLRELERD